MVSEAGEAFIYIANDSFESMTQAKRKERTMDPVSLRSSSGMSASYSFVVLILIEIFGVRPFELPWLVGKGETMAVGNSTRSTSSVRPRMMLRALSAARRELAYTRGCNRGLRVCGSE